MSYDVAIVGLGAMGSAAAWHLASRGARVIGLDRFTPPHPYGSSHGYTRIIREAYFESPVYVPLVQRAAVLWTTLGEAAGTPLLLPTGGLTIAPPGSALVEGAATSARVHALRAEIWSAEEIRTRVPVLHPRDGMVGLWEPRAGLLYPEPCVRAMLDQARLHGAELVFDTLVTGWTADNGGVRVATAARDYFADRLVLTAGPWIASLVPALRVAWQVERAVQHWFEPVTPRACTPDRLPVFMMEVAADLMLYGLPDTGDGVKIALHHGGGETTVDTVRRTVNDDERLAMTALARQWVPGAAGRWLNATVCLYTNSPDGHFVIDRHPETARAIVASPCSGHGFKFAAAIGEVLADMVGGVTPAFDITPFRLGRF